MTDHPENPTVVSPPPADDPPPAPSAWSPPLPLPAGTDVGATLAERPEIAVGGAFAGGFVLALLLKRLAR